MTVSTPPRQPSLPEPVVGSELTTEAAFEALREQALIEEARQRARRRRRRYGAVAAAVVAAALGAFFALAGRGGSPPAAAQPRTSTPASESALQSGGQLSVIGIPLNGRQQPASRSDGRYGFSTVGPRGDLRYLVRCPGGVRWCGWVESLDWSQDGRWLALSVTSYGSANPYNGIHVIDVETGVDRQLRSCLPPECDWFDLDWSPDGARLAYASGGQIYVINRDGSGRRLLLTATPGPDSSPSWSADGTEIAFAARPQPYDPSLVYVIRSDGTHRRLLARGASAPAWSPDGATIAFASRCGGIKLVTPAGRDVTPGRGACRVIGIVGISTWSPGGKRLAIAGHWWRAGSQPGVYVMDAHGANLRLITHETNGLATTGRADLSWQPRHPD